MIEKSHDFDCCICFQKKKGDDICCIHGNGNGDDDGDDDDDDDDDDDEGDDDGSVDDKDVGRRSLP